MLINKRVEKYNLKENIYYLQFIQYYQIILYDKLYPDT